MQGERGAESSSRPGAVRVTSMIDRYDAILLDLDGVVYRGVGAIPHAAASLAHVRQLGRRVAFVTNNASRTPAAVAAHLVDLGIPARAADVVTSAQAAAHVVADLVTPGAAVLVIGGDGVEAALVERGLRPVRSLADAPAAVIQGYAPEVDWRQLAEGAYAIQRGLPWIATNADMTIPTERGIAPGNGALLAAVRAATGVEPIVVGKPELPLHREAVQRTGARWPLVVGDRLDTDIAGASRAGTDSAIVLTGVTTPAAMVAAAPDQRPTYVLADLRGLLAPYPRVVADGSSYACGGWTVRASGGHLKVMGDGDPMDGLRALCAAAWSAGSPHSSTEVADALVAIGL